MREVQISGPKDIVSFVLAGKATFTILSKRTGVRFTYKVSKTDDNANSYFVNLMTGQSNESDYTYIGMLYNNNGSVKFVPGKKSRIAADVDSVKGFGWFASNMHKAMLSSYMHFFHSGRCCHCAKKLTTPESVITGWGPICRARNFEAIETVLAA